MEAQMFYREAVAALERAGLPLLVGGAYALGAYTGIQRQTKDFDVFVRSRDAHAAFDVLAAEGYRTELTFPHWLGKAYHGDDFIDVIFSSGNGVAVVDDEWFDYAIEGDILGMKMKVCPAEEMIWSKAFVVERERFDGADIMHLIRARGAELDWERLIRRFDRNWRVLLSHLVLFGYVYPGERGVIPRWVMQKLLHRVNHELVEDPPESRVCQGTLLSRAQYLIDIEAWGYEDARMRDDVQMTSSDIQQWTAAIEDKKATYVKRNGSG
jgi:hypothetical protein